MKPTKSEIVNLLLRLLDDCEEHNSEYHHITSKELLAETRATIAALESPE